MKFLVDAQLPRGLARFLQDRGFDAMHTLDLPHGNRTTDNEINVLSMSESRVLISKDSDFFDRFNSKQEPYKLLYLTTGNITNAELIELFEKNLLLMIHSLQNANVIEVNRKSVITIL